MPTIQDLLTLQQYSMIMLSAHSSHSTVASVQLTTALCGFENFAVTIDAIKRIFMNFYEF